MLSMLKGRLHPIWVGGKAGYLYSVIYDGELLVDRSRDPECDAARALLAKGITGKLTLCDGKTGVPRIVIDIEKAAKLTVREEGLRFVRWTPFPSPSEDRRVEAHSPEDALPVAEVA